MKHLTFLLIAVTFSLSTGCGKKSNPIVQPPDQNLQAAQLPVNANPAYQQTGQGDIYQTQVPAKFPPDSPDMSNPANSNLPETPTATPSAKAQIVSKKAATAVTDSSLSDFGTVPELAPSAAPSEAPAEDAPPVKLPWYKRVIEKVKSIFSKSS